MVHQVRGGERARDGNRESVDEREKKSETRRE